MGDSAKLNGQKPHFEKWQCLKENKFKNGPILLPLCHIAKPKSEPDDLMHVLNYLPFLFLLSEVRQYDPISLNLKL